MNEKGFTSPTNTQVDTQERLINNFVNPEIDTETVVVNPETPELSGANDIYEFFGVEKNKSVAVVENAVVDDNNVNVDSVAVLPDESEDSVAVLPDQLTDTNTDVLKQTDSEAIRSTIIDTITSILDDPTKFSSQELDDLKQSLFDIMAGRSYEDFLEQEADSELAVAVESLKSAILNDQNRQKENVADTVKLLSQMPSNEPVVGEIVEDGEDNTVDIEVVSEKNIDAVSEAPTGVVEELDLENIDSVDISPETVSNIKKITNEAGETEELQITVNQDGEEKTISIKKLAALALFVTADMMLFNGNISYALASLGGSALGLAKIAGFKLPEGLADSSDSFNEDLIETANTNSLVEFFNQRKDGEMFKFLSGVKKETRDKMLSGQRFGGFFGKHQLNQEQIVMVLSKLDENQKLDLDLDLPK